MAKYCCYFLFLVWVAYLIVSSILLFINGFLLTRVTQHINATCAFHSEVPCLSEDALSVNITNGHELHCSEKARGYVRAVASGSLNDINSASSVCLPPRSKVILVLIDALRYDFTVTDASLKAPRPYQNKLPVMDKLLKEFPSRSRLFKFMADPPTTTMQRLKALTSGSLPTFIDAGSNFATPEINEDNIIDQLVRHNQSIIFMGDDTWTGLYPNRFSRSFPFPSFNVWDLDTVDTGVIKQLYPEIGRPDWSMLIAHFLGVDHCGHRYGPNHPEMSRKLMEMNTVIENVIDLMDDQTVLFVIGDHGMTSTGDHGGESADEVTAAMFVHSKKPLLSLVSKSEEVKQVDIVPTLAATLGIPIPYSNLGSIVLNALPVMDETAVPEWKLALFSLWANVQQLMDYIREYSATTDTFKEDTLKLYYERFSVLNSKIRGVVTEEQFAPFAKEAGDFLVELRKMCEEVWVQFDPYSMSRGLLFLFLSLFFVYLIVDGIPHYRLPEIFMSSFLPFSYGAMILAAVFVWVLHYFNLIDNLLHNIFFATCFISQFTFAILIVQNWELISLNWYDRSKKNRLVNFVCRIILVFNVFGLFSNSYIIEEAYVLLFCLVTVILVVTLEVGNHKVKPSKTEKGFSFKWSKIKLLALAFGIAGLVRFSTFFWRCREEQQWCFLNPHESSLSHKTETTKVQWMLTVICVALFVTTTKSWLKNCGNLNGYSVTVTLARFAPTVIVVCSAGFWVLNRLPNEAGKDKISKPWQTDMLAWMVYSLSGMGILSVLVQPLCVYFITNRQISVEDNREPIPQLFQQIKDLFKERSIGSDVPIIYGLGTVYSSAFIILGVYLTLVISLLLGDAAAPSAVIMFLTAAFVLIATSILRIERAHKLENLFEVPNILLLIWVIISQYFFYGSGHQPTFPNIPWEAAFVGVPGTFSNNYLPAALVIINTFSSYILIGFMLPLLLITPFTVLLVMPSFVTKKNDLVKDPTRGEVLLYERDNYMVTTVFSLCCKYILCHAFRVFASMLSATIHCRHLMVWKIFAPKLIFESVGMLVTLTVVIISFLVLVRVNVKVDRFIVSLNKRLS